MSISARVICLSLLSMICWTAASAAESWPEWQAFDKRFVQADGRVVDVTFGGKSTSEGQSYGLFFALVADHPQRFKQILDWTAGNLADGDLGARLPAWWWGKKPDGSWGIKDQNAASDADLWIAYALLQAGRLWRQPAYTATARALMKRIAQREVVDAGHAGLLLLPAPVGFDLGNGRYRIDPSYLPGFIFAAFAAEDPKGPWHRIWQSWLQLAPAACPHGMAPDTIMLNIDGDVVPEAGGNPTGSYDAIRVYLWAGMSGENSRDLLPLLKPFAALTRERGAPPERVNPVTGKVVSGTFSPIGFSGALLPFLHAIDDQVTLTMLRRKISEAHVRTLAGQPTNYYDQALILFGQGWLDGHYRFDATGNLQPDWAR